MQREREQSNLGSDLELERRICASLIDHHVPSLRNVKVEARSGTVVLRGEVSSFYAKQLSQHSARQLAGENRVVDQVSVVTPATFRDPLRLRQAVAGTALLFVILSTGCSKSEPSRLPVQPVSGKVLFDGRPAAGAWVVFHPKTGDFGVLRPKAKVDGQGNFTLGTYEPQDGAPVGEYAVTLEFYQAAKGDFDAAVNLIPPKYTSPQTTNIIAKIAEGPNIVPIKIVR